MVVLICIITTYQLKKDVEIAQPTSVIYTINVASNSTDCTQALVQLINARNYPRYYHIAGELSTPHHDSYSVFVDGLQEVNQGEEATLNAVELMDANIRNQYNYYTVRL
jgi:hypothetical protein